MRILIAVCCVVLVLACLVPPAFYIWNFGVSEISDSPTDWGVLGDYIGGLLNPIISFATLCVTGLIAFVAFRLEAQSQDFEYRRQQENSQPIGYVDGSDYENSLKVVVKNIGVGPLRVDKFKVYRLGVEDGSVEDLVKLMPDLPEGMYWRNFNINGLPPFIYQQSGVVLLQLDGDMDDQSFCAFRDRVRKELRNVVVELHYSDIYGNTKNPVITILDFFGRHTSPEKTL